MEKEIVELKITLIASDGKILESDLSKEDQKIILSMLLNFYTNGIPTKK